LFTVYIEPRERRRMYPVAVALVSKQSLPRLCFVNTTARKKGESV
jgi:hypothetical protein